MNASGNATGKLRRKALKRLMRKSARQNLVPKARTKKELAEQKADEEKLADARKKYDDYGHEWLVQNAYCFAQKCPCFVEACPCV